MGKYVNESRLNSRKITSTIILVIGIIGFVFWGFILLAALMYMELQFLLIALFVASITALHAAMIIIAILIKRQNDMVYLYARYFEGDIDGYIYLGDMVNVVRKDEFTIYNELSRLQRKRILGNFFIRNFNGRKQIVLESKIIKCQCKNCGAIIDKRVYFAGICPYCQSSDIYAELMEK